MLWKNVYSSGVQLPRCQVTWVTTFFSMGRDICGFPSKELAACHPSCM